MENNEYGEALSSMHIAIGEFLRIAATEGETSPEEAALEILEALPRETRLMLFFQLVGQWIDPNASSPDWRFALTEAGKHTAIDLAKIMGPDYSHGMQAFAALFSKMA